MSGPALTPTPLSSRAGPLKKITFFAASITDPNMLRNTLSIAPYMWCIFQLYGTVFLYRIFILLTIFSDSCEAQINSIFRVYGRAVDHRQDNQYCSKPANRGQYMLCCIIWLLLELYRIGKFCLPIRILSGSGYAKRDRTDTELKFILNIK